MKKKPDIILLKIENAVVNREYDKALTLIEENAAVLFSYRDVKPVIALIGDIPEDRFKTPLRS